MCESPETHTCGATIERGWKTWNDGWPSAWRSWTLHTGGPRDWHGARGAGSTARHPGRVGPGGRRAARVVEGGDARPSLRTTRRGALGHVSSDQGAAIVGCLEPAVGAGASTPAANSPRACMPRVGDGVGDLWPEQRRQHGTGYSGVCAERVWDRVKRGAVWTGRCHIVGSNGVAYGLRPRRPAGHWGARGASALGAWVGTAHLAVGGDESP